MGGVASAITEANVGELEFWKEAFAPERLEDEVVETNSSVSKPSDGNQSVVAAVVEVNKESVESVSMDEFQEVGSAKGEKNMYSSDRSTARPWHKGKKYGMVVSILAGLLALDSANAMKSISHLMEATGIRKVVGDGSDGYVAYADYVLAQSEYDAVKQRYDQMEGTLKGEALFDEVEKLRAVRKKYKSARENFLAQLDERTELSASKTFVVTNSAKNMTIASLPPDAIDEDDAELKDVGSKTKAKAEVKTEKTETKEEAQE